MNPNNNSESRSTFVVRMPNGKYIEKWKCNQDFDFKETDDIFHACLIDKDQFETFFKNENATWLAVNFTATFK